MPHAMARSATSSIALCRTDEYAHAVALVAGAAFAPVVLGEADARVPRSHHDANELVVFLPRLVDDEPEPLEEPDALSQIVDRKPRV